MAADENERLDEIEIDDTDEDEFEDDEDSEVDAELDDFDDDSDDDDEDIDAVVAITSKDQNARSLEIRRAIEERMEERRFHEDIDYLDYDLDD